MLPIRYILWGVPFHTPRRSEVYDVFSKMLEEEGVHMVFTPNPEIMLTAEETPAYKKILSEAYWNLPDGHGLLWASTFVEESKNAKYTIQIYWIFLKTYSFLLLHKKYLTRIIPETVTGSDTFFEIHHLFKEKKTRVFYFGGEGGVEKQISEVMVKRYPGLLAVGSCGGYPFRSEEENDSILKQIEASRAEVVFVALNFPKQEMWIYQNQDRLSKAGVRIAMGIGGTFDFAVGKIKRAPRWMQHMHIEWLWRLIKQPQRANRIILAVFYFPWKVLQQRLRA